MAALGPTPGDLAEPELPESSPARVETFSLVAPEGWTAVDLADVADDLARLLARKHSRLGLENARTIGRIVTMRPVLLVELLLTPKDPPTEPKRDEEK